MVALSHIQFPRDNGIAGVLDAAPCCPWLFIKSHLSGLEYIIYWKFDGWESRASKLIIRLKASKALEDNNGIEPRHHVISGHNYLEFVISFSLKRKEQIFIRIQNMFSLHRIIKHISSLVW